jgi:hypothetical protein
MLSAFCNAICNLQFAICNLQFAIYNLQFAIYFRFLFNFLITTNFDRIVQYSSKYCIIVQFHHAFSILHHCMLPCNAALPGSFARQPCPPALPTSLAEKFASCFTAVGRHACMQYCILLLGRQFSSSFPRN